MAPTLLTPARVGPFSVTGRLGRGGAGDVLDARTPEGLRVALKVAHDAGVDQASGDAILRREAELSARLRRRWGPGLVSFGHADGRAYLALAFTAGEPLHVAAEEKRFGQKLVLAVGHAVASALTELHEADAVHGDVTPANILVGDRCPKTTAAEERAATLIDLSLSGVAASRRAGLTPRYAFVPEDGAAALASPESDVFSLGLVLGELMFPELARAKDLQSALREALQSAKPTPLVRLVSALASPLPGARPPASYVASALASMLGLTESAEEAAQSRRASIARHYLSCRRTELFEPRAVKLEGPPLAWVTEARTALRCEEDASQGELGPLDELGRARWLTRLAGPAATGLAPADMNEGELAERLLELSARLSPASFTPADLARDAAVRDELAIEAQDDLHLLRALSSRTAPEAALRAVEARASTVPSLLVVALGERLLATGQAARAALVLSVRDEPEVIALAAEARRRTGDRAAARELATRALRAAEHAEGSDAKAARARAHFVLARVAWELGEHESARAHEKDLGPAEAAEISALCHYAKGEIEEGLRVVERALLADGTSARLFGLAGMLRHAEGEAAGALDAFGRAVEASVALGAVADEATYRTGEAAAALDLGDVGRGLSASTRAVLLCERGRERHMSARAWLARAGALTNAGATFEALAALREARERAVETSDARCLLYADLIRIDLLPPEAQEREGLAKEALALARTLGAEDTLRALCRGALVGDALAEAESLALGASVTARLEYLRARAAQSFESLQNAREITDGLLALTGRSAPAQVRATAWERGQKLALRAGDREAAGRFDHLLTALRAQVEATVPAAYKGRFLSQSWVAERGEARGLSLPSAKLGELFSITRALSARESLRELCEMTLDAMVLWSGVERGVLLLPAPDGTLKVRAARNIAREDLRGGETQRLSMSMAARAFEKMVTVVADDAWAQSGNVQGSVHALGLRSVLAVPLVTQGACVGVVYLDDRQKKGAFGREELLWVELIGHLSAISIRDARIRASLRRMTRRAERAQTRLSSLLTEREKELSVVTERLAQVEGTRVSGMIGDSMAMRTVESLVRRVAKSDVPVLISGESGTGKELVARAIAEASARGGRAFVGENCGSLPEPLLESTLFGHAKGAFTGAVSAKVGLFDVADGGTLFLDEVGEMSGAMQVKLLRVLQDGEVRPVGSNKAHHVDVRILCATHRDLPKMVEQGLFREDLFYRLNVIQVRVPPLRERREDVPALVLHFIQKYAPDRRLEITPAAMRKLASFAWPGNVRQLENEVRRAVVLCDRVIDVDALSEEVSRTKGKSQGTLRARIDELETDAVREALRQTNGNQTRAATLLGVSRFGLQKMKKRLGFP